MSWDNWGYFMPQNILEPNQVFGGEFCGGANFSEYTSQGIWGWADTQCERKAPVLCRQARECLYAAVHGRLHHSCGTCLLPCASCMSGACTVLVGCWILVQATRAPQAGGEGRLATVSATKGAQGPLVAHRCTMYAPA